MRYLSFILFFSFVINCVSAQEKFPVVDVGSIGGVDFHYQRMPKEWVYGYCAHVKWINKNSYSVKIKGTVNFYANESIVKTVPVELSLGPHESTLGSLMSGSEGMDYICATLSREPKLENVTATFSVTKNNVDEGAQSDSSPAIKSAGTLGAVANSTGQPKRKTASSVNKSTGVKSRVTSSGGNSSTNPSSSVDQSAGTNGQDNSSVGDSGNNTSSSVDQSAGTNSQNTSSPSYPQNDQIQNSLNQQMQQLNAIMQNSKKK